MWSCRLKRRQELRQLRKRNRACQDCDAQSRRRLGISGFVKAAEIVNCVNYGEISFTDYFNGNTGTGSIVGKFHSSAGSVISNCYNFGSVTGRDNDTTQTGLIGGLLQVLGTIENCYSVPSGNLEIAGSNMISGFELKDNKIVAKTDAEYAAMESAAAAIEDSVFEITIPLKIHYVYSNGDKAAEDYIADLREGEDYNVEPPAITGYAPDKEVITGKMGNTPLEITVTYSLRNFTLTIEYVFEDGSKAAESYVDTKPYGTEFSVESPVLEGYEANFPLVEGKYEVDRTIKVKYTSTGDVTETSEGAETTTPPRPRSRKPLAASRPSALPLFSLLLSALQLSQRSAGADCLTKQHNQNRFTGTGGRRSRFCEVIMKAVQKSKHKLPLVAALVFFLIAAVLFCGLSGCRPAEAEQTQPRPGPHNRPSLPSSGVSFNFEADRPAEMTGILSFSDCRRKQKARA